MGWSYARPIIAFMTGDKSFWNRTAFKFPSRTSGILREHLIGKLTVAIFINEPSPNPTSCLQNQWPILINFIPKSLHFASVAHLGGF